MAYEKYTTDALVLGSFERRESDKTLVLYTRDFGLVYASASGVRKEHSRLRPALQDYSRAYVSLVRGKRGWRVVGVESAVVAPRCNTRGIAAFVRVAKLLRRLVHGEETHSHLFDALAHAHLHFFTVGEHSYNASVELVCVARVLHALGYLSAESLGSALFASTSYADAEMKEAETKRYALLRSVNEAIEESQL